MPKSLEQLRAERATMVDSMIRNLEGLLCNLYARWQDEKEYEDIADYGKVIAKELPARFKLEGMTKRPFGFKFVLPEYGPRVYHLTVTNRHIQWKSV